MNSLLQKDSIIAACRAAWGKAGHGSMLLGVSGGADSTALLLAFHMGGIPCEVAHCNFGLRGEESFRDRRFVEDLCRARDIKCHFVDFNVPLESYKGESTEMVCRRLRYSFFRDLKDRYGFRRIVIAHNADDNIETFFLNALRGSSSRGLKGMQEDSGEILRPLLRFPRNEILDFLQRFQQSFITDSSNLKSDCYRRNFLRNDIFPLLESRWEGFNKAVTNTINLQGRDNRIVEFFLNRALEGVSDTLPWNIIREFPDAVSLIYRFIERFGGSSDIAEEMAASAVCPVPGKNWRISEEYRGEFQRDGIRILPIRGIENYLSQDIQFSWFRIKMDGSLFEDIIKAPLTEIYLPFGEDAFTWTTADTKMKIKSLGMTGSQSVWKILKDAGIPSSIRSYYPVLLDKVTAEPVWIPGLKRSRFHLVSSLDSEFYQVTTNITPDHFLHIFGGL